MSLTMPETDKDVLARRVDIVRDLSAIVPGEGVISGEREMRPYESDGLTAYRQLPFVVVLPETTEQVAQVLRYCHEHGIRVVPPGGGRSLSGGALPLADGVLLGMGKFNRIREIDFENRVAVVEPGVTNLAISQAAPPEGFYSAPTPPPQTAARASRVLLRTRPVLADPLHHRREHSGELRRRALPEIRHDHEQRARL